MPKIQPKEGHALFFPNRSQRDRVVIGRTTRILFWRKEDYKEISLAPFDLHLDVVMETKDDLCCNVTLDLEYAVARDDAALEAASQLGEMRSGGGEPVTEKAFEAVLKPTLHKAVEDFLGKISYEDLLAAGAPDEQTQTTSDEPSTCSLAEQSVHRRLRAQIRQAASQAGFAITGQVIIAPQQPSDEAWARDRNLRDCWDKYVVLKNDHALEVLNQRNVANEATQVEEQRRKDEEEDRKKEAEIRLEERKAAFASKRRGIEKKDEKEKLTHKQNLDFISADMEKVDVDANLRELAANQRIADQKKKNDAVLVEMDRAEEVKSSAFQREKAKVRRDEQREEETFLAEIAEDILNRAKLEKDTGELAAQKTRVEGEAKAAVERDYVLAAHAHEIEAHRQTMEVLPQVSKIAYGAIEKIGDVRIICHGGEPNSANSAGSLQDVIQQLIRSVWTIPLVQQSMKEMSGWMQSSPASQAGTSRADEEPSGNDGSGDGDEGESQETAENSG